MMLLTLHSVSWLARAAGLLSASWAGLTLTRGLRKNTATKSGTQEAPSPASKAILDFHPSLINAAEIKQR